MSDFSSVPIPPRQVGEINQASPKPAQQGQNASPPEQASFEENLKEALGQVGEQAHQVSNTNPGIEDLGQAMEAAKNAFEETMHAHQMMQNLVNPLNHSQPPENTDDSKQEE